MCRGEPPRGRKSRDQKKLYFSFSFFLFLILLIFFFKGFYFWRQSCMGSTWEVVLFLPFSLNTFTNCVQLEGQKAGPYRLTMPEARACGHKNTWKVGRNIQKQENLGENELHLCTNSWEEAKLHKPTGSPRTCIKK